MSNDFDNARKLVSNHIRAMLTPYMRALIHAATLDIYHGPFYEHHTETMREILGSDVFDPMPDGWRYPGWPVASEEIREWFDANVGTLYVDTECDYVGDVEPEGWEDPEGGEDDDGNPVPRWVEPEPYWTLDLTDIMRAVLGGEFVANM